MSGKWAGSERRSRLPANWPELVNKVKKRARKQCEKVLPSGRRCPRKGTDVDHIIPGDDHRMTNLRLLCEAHHAPKSSREGHAAKAAIKKKGLRQEEPHPGTIR